MRDAELLEAYGQRRSEEAFRTLVERYVRLVYQACWRQLGEPHLAEDATQAVFILLSQNAGKLAKRQMADGLLGGWLLTTARYACANILRTRRRRARREQRVAEAQAHEQGSVMREHGSDPAEAAGAASEQAKLAGMLDDGLHRLSEKDRLALSLRYLQGLPLRKVGTALGVSEDAARKRVDRGLEKLREYFLRRGVTAAAPMLAAFLIQQGSGSMLTGPLQAAVVQGVLGAAKVGLAGPTAGAAAAKGAQVMMLAAQAKLAAGIVLAAGMVGTGTYVAVRAMTARPAEVAAVAPVKADGPVDLSRLSTGAATQGGGAQGAVSVVPVVAKVKVELGTPKAAMRSLAEAIRAGDAEAVQRCVAADLKRPMTLNDAMIAWAMAEHRLVRVSEKAFGPTAGHGRTTTMTLDWVLDLIASLTADTPLAMRVTGDVATVELQQIVAQNLPANTPPTVKAMLGAWSKATVRLKKGEEGWKFDLDGSVRVVTGVVRTGDAATDRQTDVALVRELAGALEETAERVERKEYGSRKEAQEGLMKMLKALPGRYEGFRDTVSIGVFPVAGEKR